jgi:transposase
MIHYRVELSGGLAIQEVLQRTRERLSTFVLITNVPREEMNDREVLSEYKSQARTVETRFRFLKDPTYVDGIYLKSVNRAYALAYVFLLEMLR